jgi:hypothetical protein
MVLFSQIRKLHNVLEAGSASTSWWKSHLKAGLDPASFFIIRQSIQNFTSEVLYFYFCRLVDGFGVSAYKDVHSIIWWSEA